MISKEIHVMLSDQSPKNSKCNVNKCMVFYVL